MINQARTTLQLVLLTTLFHLAGSHLYAQGSNLCTGAGSFPITGGGACNNVSVTLSGTTTYTGIGSACGASGGNRNDVWFSFTAQSTSVTITPSGTIPANIQMQVFTATSCGGLASSIGCDVAAPYTFSTLTVGTAYLLRVYSNTNATGTFNICMTDLPPANDNCAGVVTLNSGTTCVNTTGNMLGATLSAITITGDCLASTPPTYDVWYRFVAQTPNPTVTISSLGSQFLNPNIQILSACSGTNVTQFACGTTSATADYLSVGTTYFVRVSGSGTLPTTTAGGAFSICITDPTTTAPFNDECANAVNLQSSSGCLNAPGTMAGSTLSTIATPGCGIAATYDVWYKFTAVSPTTNITLSGGANNFTNRNIQVFSGTCGALTSVACGASPLSVPTPTAGEVFYVRVYSTTAGLAPNGNAGFSICMTGTTAPVRFGNSYVNISKKAVGGPVQPGDILEIRMSIFLPSGTIYSPRFVDNIPTNTTMLTTPSDRLRIITNEGLPYKEYTLNSNDDPATFLASPPPGEYNIRMNLGLGGHLGAPLPGNTVNNTATETASITGQLASNHRPQGGGGLLFSIAYRVEVNAGTLGSVIDLQPAQFRYKTTVGGPDVVLTATPYKILIRNPDNLCTNAVGVNSVGEFGGTFGTGTTLARQSDLATPITGYTYIANPSPQDAIGDGRYSIVKNISPKNGVVRNSRQIPNCDIPTPLAWNDPIHCSNRMYNHWYVDGDHTGTNNAIGNTPPAKNISSGYMLLVNSDFIATEAYRQTINNLCPNTYYEFSAWVRNVCSTCGADSLGQQFTSSADPARHAGVVGVYPNLSFAVDGVDYYSTGEVDITGWEKRGFVFRTGPTQTSATFTIRTNSQGGGGNDWAMDDITVTTCLPTMNYTPSATQNFCIGSTPTITNTIRSFYNSYTHYKWQRRPASGTWGDIAGATGSASPTLVSGEWEYTASYTIPNTNTTLANNGDQYRMIVSTVAANLSDANCQVTDGVSMVTLAYDPTLCSTLSFTHSSFNGRKQGALNLLSWSTTNEQERLLFSLERSTDGRQYTAITVMASLNQQQGSVNNYRYTDSVGVSGRYYYRVKATNNRGGIWYSAPVLLAGTNGQSTMLYNVANPFSSKINFSVSTNSASFVEATLSNLSGRIITQKAFGSGVGSRNLQWNNLAHLPAGIYVLQVKTADGTFTQKLVKQ